MAETYIEMFEEKYYPDIFLQFGKETIQYFDEHYLEIKKEMEKEFRDYLDKLIEWQKSGKGYEISEITISFLYTSVDDYIPRLRLDSYGEIGRVYGESVLTGYLSAKWLVAKMDNFVSRLRACVEKQKLKRYIRAAEFEVLKLRAIRGILGYYSSRFKYIIKDVLDMKKLAKVQKTDIFVIEMGEYMDWQRVIFALLPEVDVFNCDSDTNLTFRRFHAITYEKKEFQKLIMNQSVFRDCTFRKCVINECEMLDCIFDNCTFEEVQIITSQMTGSLFIDCIMKQSQIEKTVFYGDKTIGHEIEYFEPAEFYQCVIFDSTFLECQMELCPVVDLEKDNLQIVNCNTRKSGFE